MNLHVLLNSRYVVFCYLLVTLLMGCERSAQKTKPVPGISKELHDKLEKDLKEVNEHFKFRGKPIQPRALENMVCWISDKHPGPVAIDMEAAYDSNRYLGGIVQSKNRIGFVRPPDPSESGQEAGSFYYSYVGKLANGLHVVHIWDSTGGSGLFESLMLIKFVVQGDYVTAGKPEYRIVMQRAGEIPLGDKTDAQLNIQGNSVVVKAANKQTVMAFD